MGFELAFELYVEMNNIKMDRVLGTGAEVSGNIYCHNH